MEIKKAIEEIKRDKESFERVNHGGFTEKIKSFEMAIAALETQQKDKWIPVSERLPKNEGNYVIAFRKSGEICVAWYEEAEETWETDACYLDNVLAWMPLPEPYKPE